ncbi:unnamed protein product, partial [Ascophyllum nodosum]
MAKHARGLHASVTAARADTLTLENQLTESQVRLGALEVQQQLATTALEASTHEHRSFTVGYRTHDYIQPATSVTLAVMRPPLPRLPSAAAAVDPGSHTRGNARGLRPY